jgi:hypothetical protein
VCTSKCLSNDKIREEVLVGSCMGEDKYGILLDCLQVRDILNSLDIDRDLKLKWITQRYTGLSQNGWLF